MVKNLEGWASIGEVTENLVRQRAYLLWKDDGCPDATQIDPIRYWEAAIQDIRYGVPVVSEEISE